MQSLPIVPIRDSATPFPISFIRDPVTFFPVALSTRIAGDPMWLPEPIATENADAGINRDEIISYSMLVLLENLNPRERATFILKEAYDYSHEDIAQALSITVENSRKLLSRAKSKLASPAKPVQETTLDTKACLENYITVIKSGDIKSLEKLLAQEVTVITDGEEKSTHRLPRCILTHLLYHFSPCICTCFFSKLCKAGICRINHDTLLYQKNSPRYNEQSTNNSFQIYRLLQQQ